MRSAAALGFLLALGILAGHALAASPGPNQLPTTTLPTSITTVVPLPTTTVRLPTTTTVPKLPTTTTVPKLPTTTTVPKLPTTTTTLKLPTTTTTTTPKVSATTTTTAVSSALTTATTATKETTEGLAAGARSSGSTAGSSASRGSVIGPSASSAPAAGGQQAAGGSQAAGSSQAAGGPQVQRFESSRPYIATKGSKKRKITLTFWLSKPARVIFAVRQVAPLCRTVGYFSVRGRKGTNRIRFAGRVDRKRLKPGTYEILARTQGGVLVQRVRLVVLEDSTPTRKKLRAALAANVCTEDTTVFSRSGAFTGTPSVGNAGNPGQVERPPAAPSAGDPSNVTEPPQSGGVFGTTTTKTAEAIRPFLVALLAAAILALGLASLPRVAVPDNRVSDLLARHRLEVTTIGAAALVAVAIAFLIG